MMPIQGVEFERQRRRGLDKMAAEGARRRRWELEAKAVGDGLVLWARPNWTAGWKA